METQLAWSGVKRLAPTIALVAILFTLGHLLPVPVTVASDPFVQTGQTSGCIYAFNVMWIRCWETFPGGIHRDLGNAMLAGVIALVMAAWIWRRLTNKKMIIGTEE